MYVRDRVGLYCRLQLVRAHNTLHSFSLLARLCTIVLCRTYLLVVQHARRLLACSSQQYQTNGEVSMQASTLLSAMCIRKKA